MDPTDLRLALDAVPGKQIRVGEMNDPSEVLGVIYDQMGNHPALTVYGWV